MRLIRARIELHALAPLRAAAAFLLLVVADLPAAAQDDAAAIREILSVGAPPVTDIDAALGAAALADLRQLYAARNERPIWLGGDAGRVLIDRLSQPDLAIGPKLRPLLDDARKRIAAADTPSRAGADLLLTALYGATAQALRPGRAIGFAAALAELDGTTDLASLLNEPAPPKAQPSLATAPPADSPNAASTVAPDPIARLRAAIAALQAQAAQGWPRVPDGPKLQLGDSGPRVEALSRRLIASGDLKAEIAGAEFDLPLQTALQRFQARHGLPKDGVVGAATIAALNLPLKDRLAALAANLQRLERAGRDPGDRYLALDLPDASYRLVLGGRVVMAGPAILGAPATPTPLLDGVIDRIELRPSYRIPQSVADRQLWPRQEADALYFVNHGIRVTDDGLRQAPGAGNPLGLAKLRLAGNDRIALHGVPAGAQSQAAFDLPDRHTSLGCVALPDIAAVVKPLLEGDPAWPEGRIAGALAGGGTQTVTLAKPLPLHIAYDTAWVDEDGTLQFRDDVYGWDKQPPAAAVNTVADPCGS